VSQIHNEIRKGWLSDAVNRALGRTREGGIERVGETVDAIMNPWGLPEWAFLRGERLCAIWRSQGAVAGEFSYIGLLNPTGSNSLVVIEAASIQSSASGQGFAQLTLEATALATLGSQAPGNVRDRRNTPASTTTAQTIIGSDVSSGVGVALENRRTAVATNMDFQHLPVVLAPGHVYLMAWATVNVGIDGNFMWRERKAYPGEIV